MALSDEQIVQRVREGDTEAFAMLLRRYNPRVYRAALSILRDDAEAEEVVQETWVRAFDHLDQFSGRGRFAMWVSRIALHEAWASARRNRKSNGDLGRGAFEAAVTKAPSDDPERAACDREIRGLIEAAIDALPEKYRLVFILREVDGLSTSEAAGALKLSRVAINTRLHRARSLLRSFLLARAGPGIAGSSGFPDFRCDRLVKAVTAPHPPDGIPPRRLAGSRRSRGSEEFPP